jgi:hypothetical protein
VPQNGESVTTYRWAKEVSIDYVVAYPASAINNDGFADFTAAACIDSATVAKAWSTDAIEAGQVSASIWN